MGEAVATMLVLFLQLLRLYNVLVIGGGRDSGSGVCGRVTVSVGNTESATKFASSTENDLENVFTNEWKDR